MCPKSKDEESPSSRFISVISGILIVVSAGAILMSLLQHELIQTRLSFEEITEFLSSSRGLRLPKIVRLYFYNLRYVAAAAFLVSVSSLVSAVGLLKRRNWARIFFMVFFILGIAWCLAGMFFYEAMIPDTLKAAKPASVQNAVEVMIVHILRLTSFCVSAGFIILFIWLIRKFISQEIRREFLPADPLSK